MNSVPPIPTTVIVKPNSEVVKFFTSLASAHSMIARTPSASIISPAETRTYLPLPLAGATMGISIFMPSRVAV